jgi:hypothetical protein
MQCLSAVRWWSYANDNDALGAAGGLVSALSLQFPNRVRFGYTRQMKTFSPDIAWQVC